MRISVKIFNGNNQLGMILPKWLQLAEHEGVPLPFQYGYMPLAWCREFCDDTGQFWQKRGKNFLGVQSWPVNTYFVTAWRGERLCGIVPLVHYEVKLPATSGKRGVFTLAGDYILHPFQDFIAAGTDRQEIINAILVKITELLIREDSIFWIGYLPEGADNFHAIRQACSALQSKSIESIEAVTYQRGGVWPWTIDELRSLLAKIWAECEESGCLIAGLKELTVMIDECSAASLMFPRTREKFSDLLLECLPRLRDQEQSIKSVRKIEALLNNTPMLFPYIDLPEQWEEYFSSLSYSTRRYFRRYLKNFLEAGGMFETVDPEMITKKDIEEYIHLHLLRWGNSSAAMCADAADYHRKISLEMAGLGMFRLFFALYRGKRIAVHSCFDIGTRREGYVTGFNPEYGRLRIGRLLYAHTIDDAIARGMQRYELGAVGFGYKMSFTKRAATAHNFFLSPAGRQIPLDELFTGFECMKPKDN